MYYVERGGELREVGRLPGRLSGRLHDGRVSFNFDVVHVLRVEQQQLPRGPS